jgi:zinc and cadmium transporter
MEIVLYSFGSVLLVSLISLIGIFTVHIKVKKLEKILIYMISFSAGALFGDVFLHLLPHIVEERGFDSFVSFGVIMGIAISLILEKVIRWRHCHLPIKKGHIHHLGIMNLVGDALHNFIDGIIIGISYIAGIPIGIATTIAVIFHQIPQEIADFGVLVYSGFSKKKALFMNFLTAGSAFIGLFLALIIGLRAEGISQILLPIAAGNFIYIAGSDLIPELHKEVSLKKSSWQIALFIIGVVIISLIRFIE